MYIVTFSIKICILEESCLLFASCVFVVVLCSCPQTSLPQKRRNCPMQLVNSDGHRTSFVLGISQPSEFALGCSSLAAKPCRWWAHNILDKQASSVTTLRFQFSLAMPSSWALVHSSQCLLRFWSTWTSMQMAQSTPQSSLTQQEEVYVPAWLHQWLSLNGHGPLPCYSLPMWLGSTVSPDPFGMPVVPPFKSFFLESWP